MSLIRNIKQKVVKLLSTLVGSHKKEAEAILKLKATILGSYWISLDPGSNSAGYAYWYGDQLVSKGTLSAKGSISKRLQSMVLGVGDKKPEVAVVERVRSNTGHIYLTWSAGALLAGVGATHTLEVSANAWKKLVGSNYVKTDENDAEAIGRFVLHLIKESM